MAWGRASKAAEVDRRSLVTSDDSRTHGPLNATISIYWSRVIIFAAISDMDKVAGAQDHVLE